MPIIRTVINRVIQLSESFFFNRNYVSGLSLKSKTFLDQQEQKTVIKHSARTYLIFFSHMSEKDGLFSCNLEMHKISRNVMIIIRVHHLECWRMFKKIYNIVGTTGEVWACVIYVFGKKCLHYKSENYILFKAKKEKKWKLFCLNLKFLKFKKWQ